MSHWPDQYFADEHWLEPRHWFESSLVLSSERRVSCLNHAITGGMLAFSCYTIDGDGETRNCRFCTSSFEQVNDLCLLFNEPVPLCEASCAGPGHRQVKTQPIDIYPRQPIDPENGPRNYDAFLDDLPFRTPFTGEEYAGVYKMYFGPVELAYDPCHHYGGYCGGTVSNFWVCSVRLHNISWVQYSWTFVSVAAGGPDWGIFCTRPNIDGDEVNEALQLQPRNFKLFPGRGIGFVHFDAIGNQSSCFALHNNYCFRSLCDDPCNFGSVAGCVGAADPDKARILDWLYMDADISFNTDQSLYQAERVADITLKNNVLATWNESALRIEARSASMPAHNSRVSSHDAALNVWYDNRTFVSNPAAHVDYPKVREGGTGTIVGIVLRSRLTGVEIPAWLTLHTHRIVMTLNVEEEQRNPRIVRTTATFDVDIRLRIQLQSETLPDDYPFSLLPLPFSPFIAFDDLSNAGQIRVEDPDNAGEEHPHEVLVPVGPDGSRVPLRVKWRGVVAPEPFGDVLFKVVPENNLGCCKGLHGIHGLVIPGERNDLTSVDSENPTGNWSGAAPSRFAGRITLMIPGFNNPNIVGCRS